MAAESGLFEETRNELVIFDDEDVLLLQGAVASAFALPEGRVHIPGARSIVLLRHCVPLFFLVRHL